VRLFTLALVWTGCRKEEPEPLPPATGPDPYDVQVGPYEVDVRYTSWGIPHVLAEDYGSLAYGMGWAHAHDRLCTLADQIVMVRSERAKYFGPGEDDSHLDSDFGWLGLRVRKQAEEGFLTLPEHIQQSIIGFAAGFSRYIEETPPEQMDPRCAGQPWVRPIDHIDLLSYYLHLGQLSSGKNLVREVGNAQPPGLRARREPPPIEILEPYREPRIGSNGWAIGKDRTESGRGMLLSNTHFPSEGELQWWESHLTIPDKLNIYGASLVGSAAINMGFNEHVAWTHTVSETPRFIVYQLTLDPESPTRYLYDGQTLEMEGTEYTVEVLGDDGSLSPVTRTLYRTRWGPVFNAPIVGWSTLSAYTWRDVNEGNLGTFPTFFGMDHATDQASFEASHRDHQGIPWVHTMFTTAEGDVLYLDSAATPNLSPEAEAAYRAYVESNTVAGLFAGYDVTMVDGADPVYEWVEDPRSVLPGSVPYDDAPRLARTDFVDNANDNYWLANPLEPLTGFPMLYGPTGTPRSARTKMNNRFLLEENGASGPDHRFSLEELKAAALSARGSVEEDLRDEVVERCTGVQDVTVVLDGRNETVDIQPACEVLASWSGTYDVDAVGAQVWREFVVAEQHSWADLTDQGRLYGDPFDPTDPVYTPSQLAPPADPDPVLEALATAVYRLGEAGIALDARLGDIQYRMKGGERIPTLGSTYFEGVISIVSHGGNGTLLPGEGTQGNVINESTELTDEGYYVNSGNSWILALEYTEQGPNASAVLVYSQSESSLSPHYADQTHLYAQQQFRPVLFHEEDILADPELEIVHLSRPEAGG
jgi:acyl-homoserine-lactone acylase